MRDPSRPPLPGRVFIIAQTMPTVSSGTPMVIRRLLEHFDPEEVVLIGRPAHAARRLSGPGPTYPTLTIPGSPPGVRGERLWMLASVLPGVATGLLAIRRFRPKAIVPFYPDEGALLVGLILHRLTGLPILPFFCDLYLEERSEGWAGRLARWLQPALFRRAHRVLCVNDGMREYLDRTYGVNAVTVPTCINTPIPSELETLPTRPRGSPFVIGYSGSINVARISSLRALLDRLGGDPGYELRFYTPASRAYLEANGLWADNVRMAFVESEAALVQALRETDAVFLPLTFRTDENSFEQLSTCFGVKSYEYFLSGRPIVLHSPDGYFITRFYQDRACGVVVTEPDGAPVVAAFESLRRDPALGRRVAANALGVANEFEGRRVASRFAGLLVEAMAHAASRPGNLAARRS